MENQEITDLIQDLESVGLSPTTEEMLEELRKDLKGKETRVSVLKGQIWDIHMVTVRKNLTSEDLEKVLEEIEDLRRQASIKRDSWKEKFLKEGREKIDSLIPILGKEEEKPVFASRKTTPKKWYSQAIATLGDEAEKKTTHYFWTSSREVVNLITQRIGVLKQAREENEAKSKLWEEFQWCKDKLISMGKITEKTAEHLSTTSIIDLAHAVLKEEHTIKNDITGEKCYCESNGENRHYHFSDSYWNGKEVVVYESSETY